MYKTILYHEACFSSHQGGIIRDSALDMTVAECEGDLEAEAKQQFVPMGRRRTDWRASSFNSHN